MSASPRLVSLGYCNPVTGSPLLVAPTSPEHMGVEDEAYYKPDSGRAPCSPPWHAPTPEPNEERPPSPCYKPSRDFAVDPDVVHNYAPTDAVATAAAPSVTPALSSSSSSAARKLEAMDLRDEQPLPLMMPLAVTKVDASDGELVYNDFRHGPKVALTHVLFVLEQTRIHHLVSCSLTELNIACSAVRADAYVCPVAFVAGSQRSDPLCENLQLHQAKRVVYLTLDDRLRLQAALLQRHQLANPKIVPRSEWTLSLWRALLPFPPTETHVQWEAPAVNEMGAPVLSLYNYIAAHVFPEGGRLRSQRLRVSDQELLEANAGCNDALWLLLQVCFFLVQSTLLDLPEDTHTGMLEVFLSYVRFRLGQTDATRWLRLEECAQHVRVALDFHRNQFVHLCELMDYSAQAFVHASRSCLRSELPKPETLPGPLELRAWLPQFFEDINHHAQALEFHRQHLGSSVAWRLVFPECCEEPEVRGWLMQQHRRAAVLALHRAPIEARQRALAHLRDVHPRDVLRDWRTLGLAGLHGAVAVELFDTRRSVYDTVVLASRPFWAVWSLCAALHVAALPRDRLAVQQLALPCVTRTLVAELMRRGTGLDAALGRVLHDTLQRCAFPAPRLSRPREHVLSVPHTIGNMASMLLHTPGATVNAETGRAALALLRAAVVGDVELNWAGTGQNVDVLYEWLDVVANTGPVLGAPLRALRGKLQRRSFRDETTGRRAFYLSKGEAQLLAQVIAASQLSERVQSFGFFVAAFQPCLTDYDEDDAPLYREAVPLPTQPLPVLDGQTEIRLDEPTLPRPAYEAAVAPLRYVFGDGCVELDLKHKRASAVMLGAILGALLHHLELERRLGGWRRAPPTRLAFDTLYREALTELHRRTPQPFAKVERALPTDWSPSHLLALHDRHVFVGVSNRDSAVFSDWALHALETEAYRSPGTLDRLIATAASTSVAAAAEGEGSSGAVADHGTMDEYDPAQPDLPYDPAAPSVPPSVRPSHKRRPSHALESEDPRQLHRHDIVEIGQAVQERVLTLQQHVTELHRDAVEHGRAVVPADFGDMINNLYQQSVAMGALPQ